jgi:hypothetical protein
MGVLPIFSELWLNLNLGLNLNLPLDLNLNLDLPKKACELFQHSVTAP